MLPNLSSGDTTTWSPIPTRFISTIIPVGITVRSAISTWEKQNALFTQEQIESDGEERKRKTKIKYWFETGSTGLSPGSLGVTVLGPMVDGMVTT